jgi:hypothetical protein
VQQVAMREHGGKVGASPCRSSCCAVINRSVHYQESRITFDKQHIHNLFAMNITFNELRRLKDRLPDGSIHRIAKELDLNVETVWNYFGGYSHPQGRPMGVHLEGGMGGGVMALDDTRILDLARKILEEQPRRS